MEKVFILMLLALTIPFTSICASSEYTEEQLRQAGGLENLLANEKKNEEKLSKPFEFNLDGAIVVDNLSDGSFVVPYSNEIEFATDVRTGFFINYPIEKQQNIYYCGPASVKTVVHIINKASDSQSVYASSMGTNYDDGTFVYKIADELDKRQSRNDYGWREIRHDIESGEPYAEDKTRLWEIVIIDLLQNRAPLISRVNTKELEQYNGKEFVHYVSVVGYHGYATEGLTKRVYYADNFYGNYGNGDVFGEYVELFDNFSRATSYIVW